MWNNRDAYSGVIGSEVNLLTMLFLLAQEGCG